LYQGVERWVQWKKVARFQAREWTLWWMGLEWGLKMKEGLMVQKLKGVVGQKLKGVVG
jgi:hypothetical protein